MALYEKPLPYVDLAFALEARASLAFFGSRRSKNTLPNTIEEFEPSRQMLDIVDELRKTPSGKNKQGNTLDLQTAKRLFFCLLFIAIKRET